MPVNGVLLTMSVQNISRRAGPYVGTGLASAYPFAFKVFKTEDVKVVRSASEDASAQDETLKLNTDYTVVLNANQDEKAGGTVTLTAPLASGLRLSILSAITPDQQMVLTNHDGFLPTTLNQSADKAIALIQELKELLERAVSVPATGMTTPGALVNDIFSARDIASQKASEALGSATSSAESAATAKGCATKALGFKEEAKKWAEQASAISGGQGVLMPGATSALSISKWLLHKAHVFDSVVELKSSMVLGQGMACITLGYYKPGDGGMATYHIRGRADEDVDDGGSIHFLKNDLVAELTDSSINVCQFGASSGQKSAQNAAFLNAIAFLNKRGGGKLHVPCGVYYVDMYTDRVKLASNISLVGDGIDATTLKGLPPKATTCAVITIQDASNVVVSDMTIDASKPEGSIDQAQWHGVAVINASTNVTVLRCLCTHTKGDGIWVVTLDGKKIPDCITIDKCRFADNTRQNIALVQCRNTRVTSCFGDGKLDVEANNETDVNGKHVIANNIFKTIAGIGPYGVNSFERSMLVTGNIAETCHLWGCARLVVTGNKFDVLNYAKNDVVVISDNVLKRVTSSIYHADTFKELIITDNVIYDDSADSNVPCVQITNPERCVVKDNLIRHDGTGCGISLLFNDNVQTQAKYLRISNNEVLTQGACVSCAVSTRVPAKLYIEKNDFESVNGSSDSATLGYAVTLYAGGSFDSVEFVGNNSNRGFTTDRVMSYVSKSNRFSGGSERVRNASSSVVIEDCEYPTSISKVLEITSSESLRSARLSNLSKGLEPIGDGGISLYRTKACTFWFDDVYATSQNVCRDLDSTSKIRVGSTLKFVDNESARGAWFGDKWNNF